MTWWPAIVAIGVSGLTTALLVPGVTRLAASLDAFDHPGPRKSHRAPIPRLGGLAIVFGIGIGVGTAVALMPYLWRLEMPPARELGYFAVAVLIILVIGVLDDLNGLSVVQKLVFQILAALIVVQLGWKIESIRLPFLEHPVELGLAGPLVSLLWIVGVTNAINLLDGLDGLANGIVAIIAMTLMLYAVLQGKLFTVIVTGAVAGACLAFLRFNWEPARLFMGDSGSLTLGFALGAFTVQSSLKSPAAVAILVPILALGLPVIDTLLVMAVRFVEGTGSSFPQRVAGIFKADRKHLHHLALSLAPKRRQIVLWLYGLVAVFCLMALWVAVQGEMWLGIWLLIIEVLVVAYIRRAGMKAEARRLALHGRQEAKLALADGGKSGELPDRGRW